MSSDAQKPIRGRGAQSQPDNPHLSVQMAADYEHFDGDADFLDELARPKTIYLPDDSQTIVNENHSPDIPFRWSVNPYRGCTHGCSYCYARPTHEYLGFSAGLDFETKVLYKPRAAELFRQWLARPRYEPEVVAFSGVTDCYQPAEQRFRLTRGCLEVAVECRQPVEIITKNALVARDLDLLAELARHRLAHVAISLTTLDEELARLMEPQTSTPAARLRAIGQLSAAGVPTQVMTAPMIPGLNDSEIPALLEAARDAGATSAGYVLLRLPTTVREVFLDWLEKLQPSRRERVASFVQSTRSGRMNDPRFGSRMRGEGVYAEQIEQTFHVFARKMQFNRLAPLCTTLFRPPTIPGKQQRLF